MNNKNTFSVIDFKLRIAIKIDQIAIFRANIFNQKAEFKNTILKVSYNSFA